MKFFKILLLPFALLYRMITDLRNYLFDIGYKKSVEFEVPVISVGNLIAGGSGKTPMIEYLIEKLHFTYSIATLSRGYGRKTRGFRLANDEDTAATIGDEPFQFYRKYKDKVSVAVGEERAVAIPEILFNKEDVNLILLDDAFQHRYVKPALNILITEFSRPFYKDQVLPMGLLRESRKGANRADVIVVTKCPAKLARDETEKIAQEIERYAPGKPVFFTQIKYGAPVLAGEIESKANILTLSGIGNPEPFEEYIKEKYNAKEGIRFADHHRYSGSDVQKIIDKALKYGPGTVVLTTEKDYGRLQSYLPMFQENNVKPGYLPIKYEFLFDENKFDKIISGAIIAVESRSE